MLNSQIKIGVLMVAGVLIVSTAILAWQVGLGILLSKKPISCGGDWSYMNKCPIGARCSYLNKKRDYLSGGMCRPYLSFINNQATFDGGIPNSKPSGTALIVPELVYPTLIAQDCSQTLLTRWVSYSDEVLSFSHPETIKFTGSDNYGQHLLQGNGCYNQDNFVITITIYQVGTVASSLEDWVNNELDVKNRINGQDLINIEKISVGKRSAMKVSNMEGPLVASLLYIWVNDTNKNASGPSRLSVSHKNIDVDNLFFDKLISSIKLVGD